MLRDGVYLIPAKADSRQGLARIAADVNVAGGQAYLLDVGETDTDFSPLFDRTSDYRRLAADIEACLSSAEGTAASDLARLTRKLHKGFTALAAIDFFPGEARRQIEARLDELDQRLRAKLEPGEPTAQAVPLLPQDPAAYQNRLWATRQRPWVDRLASAWLICRLIDPQARFLWLASPADCPPAAVGFDFDAAAFSHRGEYVSFETLMHSFGLAGDAALKTLARVVHYLDVGGLPEPEAAGLETLLAGMRESLADDDALLAAALPIFDFLYAHYQQRAASP